MSRPPRLHLVTCDALPDGDAETRFLAARLAARGWSPRIVSWSDPSVAWREADLVVIRTTWDYPDRLDAFLEWVDDTARVAPLHNPPALVRGNVDKRYLLDLAAREVPVVPSEWLPDLHEGALDGLRARHGWGDVVAKPCVGLDGHGVVRLAPGQVPAVSEPAPAAGWLVQPFIAGIVDRGELSVSCFDGSPAHATRKRPPAGGGPEFRVQERWGGSSVACDLAPGEAALARRVVEAAVADEAPPLYARVDLVEWEGALRVAEVELVEPSLYFLGDPARSAPFEAALARRLSV